LHDRSKKTLENKAGDNKIKYGILAGVTLLGFFAVYKFFTGETTSSHSQNMPPALRK
jgi:hypothetical protein